MADKHNDKVERSIFTSIRLPRNPVKRLFCRELGGIHKSQQQPLSSQIFHKLPARLCFRLKALVTESILQEGYIFLGFTKNGQFVLSYSLTEEVDDHTAFPIFVYRLQWWRFVPYKRLKKLAEVRLFGEEEIQKILNLAFYDWPTDSSCLLIYGYCTYSDNEEKHQCYVTIAASPAVGPCEECNQLKILHSHSGGLQGPHYVAPPRCIQHAFTVHTRYDLAPPHPPFCPRVQLCIDGVLLLNTGDSLLAISVNLEDNHGGFGFGLYSPRRGGLTYGGGLRTRSISNLSSFSSETQCEDKISLPSQEPLSAPSAQALRPIEDNLNLFSPPPPPPPPPAFISSSDTITSSVPRTHNTSSYPTLSQLSSASSDSLPPLMSSSYSVYSSRDKISEKENLFSSPLQSPQPDSLLTPHQPSVASSNASPNNPITFKSTQCSLDIYNFDDTPNLASKKSLLETPSLPLQSFPPNRGNTFRTPGSATGRRLPPEISSPQSDEERWTVSSKSPASSFESLTTSCVPPYPVSSLGRNLFPIASPAGSIGGAAGTLWEVGSSCSSCVSGGSIVVQNESQTFTYSVRRYAENPVITSAPAGSVNETDDDLSLAYHSVLPLEVHGANYSHLKLLTKPHLAPQLPCVVVKQLTLDIEQYLGETLKAAAGWGHRYLAFTDYDLQILEVCSATTEVVSLVCVLVRARPPLPPGFKKDSKYSHTHRYAFKVYETKLKFVWNLTTGSYTTLIIEDLIEVKNSAIKKHGQRWQPGFKICESIQRRFNVPIAPSKSVRVFTNNSVLKGDSLKIILDRLNYLAIIL